MNVFLIKALKNQEQSCEISTEFKCWTYYQTLSPLTKLVLECELHVYMKFWVIYTALWSKLNVPPIKKWLMGSNTVVNILSLAAELNCKKLNLLTKLDLEGSYTCIWNSA
jgi:hypothetical protein